MSVVGKKKSFTTKGIHWPFVEFVWENRCFRCQRRQATMRVPTLPSSHFRTCTFLDSGRNNSHWQRGDIQNYTGKPPAEIRTGNFFFFFLKSCPNEKGIQTWLGWNVSLRKKEWESYCRLTGVKSVYLPLERWLSAVFRFPSDLLSAGAAGSCGGGDGQEPGLPLLQCRQCLGPVLSEIHDR